VWLALEKKKAGRKAREDWKTAKKKNSLRRWLPANGGRPPTNGEALSSS
jgi:hypothetical protein